MDINKIEVDFLNWCGFCTDNGYYQSDIDYHKSLYHQAWLVFLSGNVPDLQNYSVQEFFNTFNCFPVEGELYTLGKEQYKIVNLTLSTYNLKPEPF